SRRAAGRFHRSQRRPRSARRQRGAYRARCSNAGTSRYPSRLPSVVVSTPDHTHAPAAVTAMRMGKHVYCQKPLTHSVWEARLMRETARQKGVCTQMGNQGTAEPGFRRGAEVVREGAIGDVAEVHVW